MVASTGEEKIAGRAKLQVAASLITGRPRWTAVIAFGFRGLRRRVVAGTDESKIAVKAKLQVAASLITGRPHWCAVTAFGFLAGTSGFEDYREL